MVGRYDGRRWSHDNRLGIKEARWIANELEIHHEERIARGEIAFGSIRPIPQLDGQRGITFVSRWRGWHNVAFKL